MSNFNLLTILSSHGSVPLKCMKVVDFLLGSFLAFFLPAKPHADYCNKDIKQILVIRPGGIGDAVFLLPILRVLESKNYAVSIICEARNAEVFVSQGYKVFFYNRLADLKYILSHKYDVIVDTEQWHYASAILSAFVKGDFKIGFATRPLRAKLFDKKVSYEMNTYELVNFLKLFSCYLQPEEIPWGIQNSFRVPKLQEHWATAQMPANGVIVSLAGSIALRRFSKNQLREIVEDLLHKGYVPVLVGGKDSLAVADQFKNDKNVLSFVGKVSLIQSAALIKQAKFFIGSDSGLMHIASALSIPVIAVFGPGNLKKWQPQGEGDQIICHNLSCAPCTYFGYTNPSCKGSYDCIKDLKIPSYIKSL